MWREKTTTPYHTAQLVFFLCSTFLFLSGTSLLYLSIYLNSALQNDIRIHLCPQWRCTRPVRVTQRKRPIYMHKRVEYWRYRQHTVQQCKLYVHSKSLIKIYEGKPSVTSGQSNFVQPTFLGRIRWRQTNPAIRGNILEFYLNYLFNPWRCYFMDRNTFIAMQNRVLAGSWWIWKFLQGICLVDGCTIEEAIISHITTAWGLKDIRGPKN